MKRFTDKLDRLPSGLAGHIRTIAHAEELLDHTRDAFRNAMPALDREGFDAAAFANAIVELPSPSIVPVQNVLQHPQMQASHLFTALQNLVSDKPLAAEDFRFDGTLKGDDLHRLHERLESMPGLDNFGFNSDPLGKYLHYRQTVLGDSEGFRLLLDHCSLKDDEHGKAAFAKVRGLFEPNHTGALLVDKTLELGAEKSQMITELQRTGMSPSVATDFLAEQIREIHSAPARA